MYAISKIAEEKARIRLAKNPRPLTRKRQIIKAELLYLPCYIFTIGIEILNKGESSEQVCVDAIQGQFAYFKGAKFIEFQPDSSRSYDFEISQNEAETIALEEYKRHLLKHSLKKKVHSTVKSIQFDKKIYYPYWLGYFRRKGALDFDVIDGLSAERQGAKMRPVFMNLLLQQKY